MTFRSHSEGPYITKWFIGLIFIKAENVNIDLTYDIQSFTDTGKSRVLCSDIYLTAEKFPKIQNYLALSVTANSDCKVFSTALSRSRV